MPKITILEKIKKKITKLEALRQKEENILEEINELLEEDEE